MCPQTFTTLIALRTHCTKSRKPEPTSNKEAVAAGSEPALLMPAHSVTLLTLPQRPVRSSPLLPVWTVLPRRRLSTIWSLPSLPCQVFRVPSFSACHPYPCCSGRLDAAGAPSSRPPFQVCPATLSDFASVVCQNSGHLPPHERNSTR